MSLFDYPGAQEWYARHYHRNNGPGDLYGLLLDEKKIPVTFYSDWHFDVDSRNREYREIVDYLNDALRKK